METRAAGSFNTVPTAAYGGGDFSRALTGRVLNGVDPLGRQHLENAVYHPQTARPVNGVSVRDMFPGNRIPASRPDPVALKMQSLFPSPDNAENVLNCT